MTGADIDPLDWYSEVGKALAKVIRGWGAMPHDDKVKWVGDVVTAIENGESEVTVPATLSKTGEEATVPLPNRVPLPLAALVAA